MPNLIHTLQSVAPWLGLSLLASIFMVNAIGVLDQSAAVRELAAAGVSGATARVMVALGRLRQLIAGPAPFVHSIRPYAAILLALSLIGATGAAHAFWRASSGEQNQQLEHFLKNTAIVGGLLIAAGWSP